MTVRILSIGLAAACLTAAIAVPATAQQQAPAASPAPPAATEQAAAPSGARATNPDRVICRSKPVLGSRLSKHKECKTAREWERVRQEANKDLNAMQQGLDTRAQSRTE